MSGATQDDTVTVGETAVDGSEIPITVRLIAGSMVGGLAGMLLMLPVLVGVPVVFDLFRTEPIVEFAQIGSYLGLEATLTLGIALFVLGGASILPLQFLVVGAFLPPDEPRYLRGATFSTIYWSGFVFAFWPGGTALTIALFLVVSLVAHWIYGTTLGYTLDRFAEIPQHRV